MVSMQIADVQDEIDHELITKAQIASKIHEVAAQVSKDYQGRDLLLVAVLKGAVNTIAAFSQALSIPVQMDFMSLSSYGIERDDRHTAGPVLRCPRSAHSYRRGYR